MSAPDRPISGASWDRVLAALEHHGWIARMRGQHGADVHCRLPGHANDDTDASATVDYRNGKVLYSCHAYEAEHRMPLVAEAIGVPEADWFDDPAERSDRGPVPRRGDRVRPRHLEAVKPGRRCGHAGPERTLRYPYPDLDGVLVLAESRKECGTCGKRTASWVTPKDVPPERRVLFRLPEIRAAITRGETIYLTEGPKSASMLAELGHAATNNPFGADDGTGGKWLPQMTEALRGAVLVVIIADHDASGYRHAAYVAGQLRAAEITVRVTRSATGRPKDDAVEHLQAGYEPEDLVDADPAVMLDELDGAAPDGPGPADKQDMTPSPEPEIPEAFRKRRVMDLAPGERYPVDQRALPPSMSLDAARYFDPGEPGFAIDQVLPYGVTVLWGPPGVGKTRLSVQWEHAKAYGVKWAGHKPAPGRVLIIDYENGAPAAMNTSVDYAPLGSLPVDQQWAAPPELEDLIPSERTLITYEGSWPGETFADKFAELEKRLREADEAGCPYRLARIDTLREFISPYPSGGNDYRWEAACLLPLNNLAKELEMSIVVIHHSNKAGQISGSTGIEASLEASYRVGLDEDTGVGVLHCSKIRGAPKRHYQMRWKDGFWIVDGEIPQSRVLATGTAAAILEYLDGNGPARLEDIKAALPKASLGVIKTTLWRMKKDKGWVDDRERGTWTIIRRTTPAAPEADRCADPACRGALDPALIAAGIRVHPCCQDPGDGQQPAGPPGPPTDPDPAGGEGERQPEDQADSPGPDAEPDTMAARSAADQQGADACGACGEAITFADQHPDCEQPGKQPEANPAHWQGMAAMQKCFDPGRSRMHPVPLILKPDDPRAKPGMQTRDLPQWQAALEADDMAEAGFQWTRPGLLDEFGPDALVLTVDRNGSFPSALTSLPVAPNLLIPAGPIDANPKTLGKTDPQTGKPTGLAGIAVIAVPPWDGAELPHPLGRRAVPGELLPVPTNMLEKLWALHEQGRVPRPEVAAAFLGRRSCTLFDPFRDEVKAARAKYADDPAMLAAVKRSSSIAIRMLLPVYKKSPWWRPDWRAADVAESAIRTWSVADRAARQGAIIAAIGRTDETSFVIPAGDDPETWTPPGYTFGRDFGQVKPKPVRIRTDRADLAGIDPSRIAPSKRDGYVSISGPLPLAVWLARHA